MTAKPESKISEWALIATNPESTSPALPSAGLFYGRDMDKQEQALIEGHPTPEFLNAEEEAMFAEFLMGEEAITFLNSNLGRLMRGFAEQQKEAAKDAVLSANPCTPWGRRRIKKHQFEAAVADQFLGFIAEALQSGKVAEENLKQMRDQA